ncbi:REP-associated tyrosine transposase [Pseudomonas paralcaligenes]|uniref:REP-associated tyrosine transposase n=1 Tax=Pseudomonas paralcaligenes TaxID=2772558 RepID=UPI001C7F0DAE|nr:transposase [Pseudomonas paralcaligenes]
MPLYRGNRLRRGRYSEAGRFYLLTTVTAGRVPLFADFFLGRVLVQEMRLAEEQTLLRSLCWVVMPDHLHWLIELDGESLERVMQQVKSRSAKQINQRRGIVGDVWQKGFHDHALRHEEDVLDIARYVVANPLRAGLVERVGDYPLWDAVWL